MNFRLHRLLGTMCKYVILVLEASPEKFLTDENLNPLPWAEYAFYIKILSRIKKGEGRFWFEALKILPTEFITKPVYYFAGSNSRWQTIFKPQFMISSAEGLSLWTTHKDHPGSHNRSQTAGDVCMSLSHMTRQRKRNQRLKGMTASKDSGVKKSTHLLDFLGNTAICHPASSLGIRFWHVWNGSS